MSQAQDFYGVEGGTDYSEMLRFLSSEIKRPGFLYPVGLIFGRPGNKAMREEILPDLSYYHHRTGKNMTLFCIGYEFSRSELYTIGGRFDENCFDAQAFVSCLDDFERQTSWRYSGETDCLLMGAYKKSDDAQAEFDFTTVIHLEFERAIEENVIRSTRRFLQDAMRFAQQSDGANFAFDLSDRLGLRSAGNVFKRLISGLIPLKLGDEAAKFMTWHVRDLTTGEVEKMAGQYSDSDLEEEVKIGLMDIRLAERIKRLRRSA
jgi:hypothetical protein